MSDDRMGTLTREGEVWRLRYERLLRHPPERVWQALTRSEDLRCWMPCDIVGPRHEGAALELPFWPDTVERYGIEQPVMTGRIRVWRPPETFEFTWDVDIVRFDLEPVEGGTCLTLTTWVGEGVPVWDTASGYHLCLMLLQRLLDDGPGGSTATVDTEACAARYRQALERQLGHGAAASST